MTFRVWFYFLVLTGFVMLFLWMLQITFIGPYYERNRTQSTLNTVTSIEHQLARDNISSAEKEISRLLTQENMCGAVYNERGTRVILVAELPTSCHLDSLSNNAVSEFISMTNRSASSDFSIRFNSDILDQGMYFYGRSTKLADYNYYIFVNTPIELLDSTVYVLKRQFGLVAMVVFSVATFVTFALSRRLSQPIVNITNMAKRLGEGDLDVAFDEREYSEVSALSHTLNYATEEFRKTDELRRDLVANVSHDIKTPLTMIKAYAEMIQDISGDNPEMREKHLKVIVEETNHLERLVNDMLTLSKYESNVFELKETRFNLLQHVQATLNLFQMMPVTFDVKINPNIFVYADEIKMGQVLYNFVNNATRYTGDDPMIQVHAARFGDEVEISVIDKGPGIEPELQDRIWDRYYRIDKNYTRTGGSSGLGLSIVRAICEASGSRYGLESKVGEGSRFYYRLKIDLS